MTMAWRCLVLLALALLLGPEWRAYRAEWSLAEANTRLERVLLGRDRGAQALASVAHAETLARAAQRGLPADPRADQMLGIALILQGRPADAVTVLDAAIAHGERPELTLSLGRARAALQDEAGADAAFLRAAWASEAAIATLPKAKRSEVLAQVRRWEDDLHAGRLRAPPPLSVAAEKSPLPSSGD